MLSQHTELSLDDQTWRRINMRKVSHLVGAEVLHNLYNRHWPRINSLRFRHTIVNYRQGIVESYAPKAEWDYLQQWMSKKFLVADPILTREIRAIMQPSYDLVNEIIHKVMTTDLRAVSNQELALLLIDIVDYPLGDIYKLNVVQIEYSLNFALHQLLQKFEPNAVDRNELLARLLAPGVLTVSQEEEVAFGEIVRLGKAKKMNAARLHKDITSRLQQHYKLYSPGHCAYGEEPPRFEDYVDKYRLMSAQDISPPTRKQAEENVAQQLAQSQKILTKLNDEALAELCGLMAEIGVFRDHNKAKLGETIIGRLKILDEISRRTKVPREDINYYLVAELTNLLDTGKQCPAKLITKRREQGVCFMRSEDVHTGILPIASPTSKTSTEVLRGICASPGRVTAIAKIIRTKENIHKIVPGDIMIAIGTDFDLLEIMNLSGGIITEEGGLLSHASVVSRELQKPCLIGVPGATTVLRDGDQLELNATTGSVRILKRGSS